MYGTPIMASKTELEVSLLEGGVHRTHHDVIALTVTYLWLSKSSCWASLGFHTVCYAWNNGKETKTGAE